MLLRLILTQYHDTSLPCTSGRSLIYDLLENALCVIILTGILYFLTNHTADPEVLFLCIQMRGYAQYVKYTIPDNVVVPLPILSSQPLHKVNPGPEIKAVSECDEREVCIIHI